MVDNTSLQADDAFKAGHYASVNLLATPMKHVLLGPEVLWGMREDKGGDSGTDVRLQVSFKYDFGVSTADRVRSGQGSR